MLPVASPQHFGDGYQRPPAFVDPAAAALLGIGGYQEMQGDHQQEQIDGVSPYRGAPSPMSQQQRTDVDLESFKNQKIQEFRQALDLEMERKRQQAQKDLENAERNKWRQLMDFQQTIQGEMAQMQTQQHVSQTGSPMHMQQNMMPASRTMPQHAMLAAANSGVTGTMNYHGLAHNSVGGRPSSVQQRGANMTGRSLSQHDPRGMSPIQQYAQHGVNISGPLVQQSPLRGANMEGSPMHQQAVQSPANSRSNQATPRNSSPIRQQNMMHSSGYLQPHQPGMLRTASPLRQRDDALQQHIDYQAAMRTGSPMRPQQSMEAQSMSMQQQDMARSSSPMRQMQTMETQPISTPEQGVLRSANPMRPTQQSAGTSGFSAQPQDPIRQQNMGASEASTYHRQGMARTASPMRQEDYGGSETQLNHQEGMARTASPMRQQEYTALEIPLHQQGMATTASPMRQQDHGASETTVQQHQGVSTTASQDSGVVEPSEEHQGMARTASPVRQRYFGQENGKKIIDISMREAVPPDESGIPQHHGNPRHNRSPSPMHSPRPPAPPYHEPARSPSRMSNMPRQCPPTEESVRYSSPSSRPPTVREMQEHFKQHRNGRGVRDDIWRTRDRPEAFTFDQYGEDESYDYRPGLKGAKSAGVERTFTHQRTDERISTSSTWNASSSRPTSPSRRDLARQQELLAEAEQLEKEYAKLTGKSPSKASAALWNVKRQQEARRRKLEALTERVVQNRRRLAHEMKNVDRPLEISFVDRLADEMNVRNHPDEIYVDDSRDDRLPSPIRRREMRDTKSSRNRKNVTKDSKSPRISRSESRDSYRTRIHRNGMRDSHAPLTPRSETRGSKQIHLAVVKEMEEPSETGEGADSRKDTELSSASEHYGDDELLSSPRSEVESSYGKDSTSQNDESSEEGGGDQRRHTPVVEKSKSEVSGRGKHKTKDTKEKHRKGKSLKSRERKGEKKAKDFVAKLREKRSQAAKEATMSPTLPHSYSREDVLAALETGKSTVTLPSRDPKLARKNRKLSSQKLVESSRAAGGKGDDKRKERNPSRGRATKIAIKKSMSSSKTELRTNTKHDNQVLESKNETKPSHAPEAHRPVSRQDPAQSRTKVSDHRDDHESPNKKKGSARRSSKKVAGKQSEARHHGTQSPKSNKGARSSSAISTISDLSESAYGVASDTGSGIDFTNGNVSDSYDADGIESISSGLGKTAYSYTGCEPDDVHDAVFELRGDGLHDDYDSKEDINEEKQKMIKVRELSKNAVAEGFEVEEGYDLQSIYSVYSKHVAENADTTDEAYQETLKGLQALQELEKRLDEEERRSVMPELLELTELHGWNMNKVVKHFARFFPQILNVKDLTLSHFLQLPVKEIQSDPSLSETPTSILPPSSHANESEPRTKSFQQSESPPSTPSTRRFTLVNDPSNNMFEFPVSPESSESGWRSRIRTGSSRRPAADHEGPIDMIDVRASLRNISRRHRRGNRRAAGYKPALRSLEEI